ncbi:MAG: FKBP-type peptidyl-prolyl cis-trans isomerase [bacterium]|nr:FKBP-type peptidyl-prolyl cis-trans isomerase [bacterium]
MTHKQLTTGIAVFVGLAVVAIFFIFTNPFAMTNTQTQTAAVGSQGALVVQDEVVGTGAEARAGDTLSVNYTGKLQDGTVFDSSLSAGRMPFQFTIGAGRVIQGWDQGLQGMKVGGKRLLIIPPELAYGAQGNGPIPQNATLVFEIDLLSVTPPSIAPAAPEGPAAD